MELENPNDGENQSSEEHLQKTDNGGAHDSDPNHGFHEEIDSTCSTPYVSAPSSPGRCPNGYFFSAPASPMHSVLSSSAAAMSSSSDLSVSDSSEFEFSARFSGTGSTALGSMISADELFLNGQIRPMKLSSHLQRPQVLAALIDLDVKDEKDEESKDFNLDREDVLVRGRDLRLRNGSLHRRARSMSPMRDATFQWHEDEEARDNNERDLGFEGPERKQVDTPSTETTPSVSASSSRSSSSGRNSKRWIFLKDFLRSKSEGRGNSKEKFWSSISFSPSKEKQKPSSSSSFPFSKDNKSETQKPNKTQHNPAPVQKKKSAGKPANVASKRRIPQSPHELLYTTNRAQLEELRKRTFLPYRQGLLGCLGFSSKSFTAMNGFAKTLNPVSSR